MIDGRQAPDGEICHRMASTAHDYPLNLSISLSGGKEINRDSPSSGE